MDLIKNHFSLNKASLALFRVVLALVFLTELLSGSFFFDKKISLLLLIPILLILIGYKTKIAIFVIWLASLLLDINFYSTSTLQSVFLYSILFWSLFLPLEDYFSVDNIFQKKRIESSTNFFVYPILFICQILVVYFCPWFSGSESMGFESWMPILFLFLGFLWPLRIFIIFFMVLFHLLFMPFSLLSWIYMAGFLAFLPERFWQCYHYLLPKKDEHLIIYYDDQCSFCETSVRLIQSFLILPHVSFLKVGINQRALVEMRKEPSWLLLSEEKGWQRGWQVWLHLVSCSPLIFYMVPIFRLGVVSKMGEWLYQEIAKRRAIFEKVVTKRRFHFTINWHSHFFSVLFVCCFVFLFLWNIKEHNCINVFSTRIP